MHRFGPRTGNKVLLGGTDFKAGVASHAGAAYQRLFILGKGGCCRDRPS